MDVDDDNDGQSDEDIALYEQFEQRLRAICRRLDELEHKSLYGVLSRADLAERQALRREQTLLEDMAHDEHRGHGPLRGTPQWKAMMRKVKKSPSRWITEVSGGLPGLGKRR